MQVVKQGRRCLNAECLSRDWEILLLLATVYPAGAAFQEAIKSHIGEGARQSDSRIADMAQFTYLKFVSRCKLGKPKAGPFPPPILQKIIKGHTRPTGEFGASLKEHMWCQRKKYPKMPVPIQMHWIASAIFASGKERTEGVFRLPGNMKKLAEIQEGLATDSSLLAGAGIHDLGSLYKSWFASLPDIIIPTETLPKMMAARDAKTFVPFADGLPPIYRHTLKYLIGFLIKFAEFQATTKMGPPNLAMVFAPNIVDMSSLFDPMEVARLSSDSKDFILALMEGWDVSDIYPLAPEMLEEAPG
jgi:hypothetical protein